MKKIPLLLIALIISLTKGAFAQPGTLDNSFDGDGKLITSISTIGDQAFSVAVQQDGKIIVAGVSNNGNADFTLVRYNDDGTLDNTFGSDGIITTPIGEGNDYAKSIAIQPDGNIVAAGYSFNGSNNDFALVRYNIDGTLDNNFSTDGKVTIAIGEADDYGLSLALQPDGGIVVGGYSYNGTDNDIALVRFHADGSIDNDFGTGGMVITPIGAGNDYAYSIAIQGDGKIVAAGASSNGVDIDFALARYQTDGTPDNSFDTDGIQTTAIGVKNDFAYSLVIQPDNKIIIGGFAYNGVDNDFALARYDSNGILDNSFGTDGIQVTAIGTDYDYANAIAITADGKIVAAGDFNNGSDFDFALTRYNSDGTPDSTFGTDGKTTTSIDTGYDYAYSVAIQPDGKIVVVGSSESGAGSHFAVARFLSDLGVGVIDFTLASNQVLIYPNPVEEHATLKYSLSNQEIISVRLLDTRGKTLRTLFAQKQEAGNHEQSIDLPTGLSPGFYFIVISREGGEQVSVKIQK